MFYHAALVFDYNGFTREAIDLVSAVEQGDLIPIHKRVSDIVDRTQPKEFLLNKYGYGEHLKPPRPVAEIESSPYRNSEVGQWFLIVMSTYMQLCPTSIGYNWANLAQALEQLEWRKVDIDRLFNGVPIGLLITPTADIHFSSIVTHDDPYWKWIRPLHTYTQGGWLSIEECKRLCTALQSTEARLAEFDYQGTLELTTEQRKNWRESIQQGYRDAITMLMTAIDRSVGLYMSVLWEWDDDHE